MTLKPLSPRDRISQRAIQLPFLLAFLLPSLGRAAAPPTREFVLAPWEPNLWSVGTGAQLEPGGGQTARLTLFTPGQHAVSTLANLPPNAVELRCLIRKGAPGANGSPVVGGASAHQMTFIDDAGFGGTGPTLWEAKEDGDYVAPLWESKGGQLKSRISWSWTVGFFKAQPRLPFRFHGFKFEGTRDKDPAGAARVVEAGPVRVVYTPDDAQWFYADLQPKIIPAARGTLPPTKLRVANLGTVPRTFTLTAKVVGRNRIPAADAKPLQVAQLTLAAGEVKEVSAALGLSLLGRYEIEYAAEVGSAPASTRRETVSVVNALDEADGFREWAGRRKWFNVPDRAPATDAAGKARVDIATADNGISGVPIFPVMPRAAKLTGEPAVWAATRPSATGVEVLSTQLSPAWLVRSGAKEMTLFGGTQAYGLGAPTRVAFRAPIPSDPKKTYTHASRTLKSGETADAAELHLMCAPWIVVWWEGARGYADWDVPYLVVLQHHPTSLALTENGLSLSFKEEAGTVAVMPLFGYAKLPQQARFEDEKTRPQVTLPAAWPPDWTRPWLWDDGLPEKLVRRCWWWARVLVKCPVDVHVSYGIDHATGSVKVREKFDYLETANDWNTEGMAVAPLSPTLAVARDAGFPMHVDAKLTDCQYPTLFGPYTVAQNQEEITYSLDVGPFWMQASEANRTAPPDANTTPRAVQRSLLLAAAASEANIDGTAWDYVDGNYVWNVQTGDFRFPAKLLAYSSPSARLDRKMDLQNKALFELFDKRRYQMDERGPLTRRYIDGPGIGNFGSNDWGDSGKLGTDMIWNAWVYAYNCGDYQTIADNWDTIVSLNATPVSMSWAGVGRAAIAEMGDEAPPMLALTRLAYAIGDRQTYAAGAYWYARELIHHCVKEGAFTKWHEAYSPWRPTLEGPTETATNLWGDNASWQGGGFRSSEKGENQWTNFYVRFDDMDTLRFHRKYATELPRRVMAAATAAEKKANGTIYFARVAVLGEDLAKANAEFVGDADPNDPKAKKPPTDMLAVQMSEAQKEFAPKLETLIPSGEPAIEGETFAQGQMGYFNAGLVNTPAMHKGRAAALLWFTYKAPTKGPGDAGNKWTFGDIRPGKPGEAVEPTTNPVESPAGTSATRWLVETKESAARVPAR